MKKFNFLIVALIATLNLNAQELVPNGGFENISNYFQGWGISIPSNGGEIIPSNVRYTGEVGARMECPNGSGNVRLYLIQDIVVVPGREYIFSYWYDDSSDNAKFRHWASFLDSNGNEIDYFLSALQPNNFLPNTPDGWAQQTFTMIAPENAVKFRMDFRTYQNNSGFVGNVYLDDVSFKSGNMSVSDLENSKVSMTSVWNNTANFNTKGNATVEIFNLNGQLVQKASGSNNFEVNVSNLTKGVYAVKVTVDGVVTTQKVVKK